MEILYSMDWNYIKITIIPVLLGMAAGLLRLFLINKTCTFRELILTFLLSGLMSYLISLVLADVNSLSQNVKSFIIIVFGFLGKDAEHYILKYFEKFLDIKPEDKPKPKDTQEETKQQEKDTPIINQIPPQDDIKKLTNKELELFLLELLKENKITNSDMKYILINRNTDVLEELHRTNKINTMEFNIILKSIV